MKVSCAEFLRDYSDFRDGYMGPAEGAEMEAHLAGCVTCSTYVELLDEGVGQLRSLPEIEPSYDFLPRLQHKLFHLEEDQAWRLQPEASATSVGFVITLVMLIASAAWLPLVRPKPPLVVLAPVAAVAPRSQPEVHALFREGPLLTDTVEERTVDPWVSMATNALYSRYTPLSSYAGYQIEPLRRR
jgi:hypothetical protein